MDAPVLSLSTGAKVIGSANTCELVRLLGVPGERIRPVLAGDRMTLGEFELEVFPYEHERVPGFLPGKLGESLHPPLRARDFRMDCGYSYRVSVGGLSFLTDPGLSPSWITAADVLFIQPQRDETYYESVLERVRPRLVVPIHWDSLFRWTARPPRRYLRPRLGWPPLKLVDLASFVRMVQKISPSTGVLVPEVLKRNEIEF